MWVVGKVEGRVPWRTIEMAGNCDGQSECMYNMSRVESEVFLNLQKTIETAVQIFGGRNPWNATPKSTTSITLLNFSQQFSNTLTTRKPGASCTSAHTAARLSAQSRCLRGSPARSVTWRSSSSSKSPRKLWVQADVDRHGGSSLHAQGALLSR